MSIRDQRADAIRARIGHGLAYDLGHWLPLLLDDLDVIAREEVAAAIEEFVKGFELAASFAPQEHEEMAREAIGLPAAEMTEAEAEPAAAPAKAAKPAAAAARTTTRRRTTR